MGYCDAAATRPCPGVTLVLKPHLLGWGRSYALASSPSMLAVAMPEIWGDEPLDQ